MYKSFKSGQHIRVFIGCTLKPYHSMKVSFNKIKFDKSHQDMQQFINIQLFPWCV